MLLPAVATVALIWTAWLWTNRTGSIVVTLLSRLPAIPTGKLFGLVVLSSLAMKLVHELGHAVVMGAVSGRSTVVGLRLAFGVPQAYADVSALATVRLRGRRLAVLFAGVSAETLAWAVVAILVLRDVRGASTIALVTVLISGPASVVFNLALPFLRNDGYFVMEELSGIANLSTKALASARMEFGAPSLATARAEPWWLAWYGALDLAYGAVASGLLPALLLQVAGVPTSLSAALGLIVGVTLSWKRMQAAVKSLGARSL
jgi:putative peptide zinc metalloprotease protein